MKGPLAMWLTDSLADMFDDLRRIYRQRKTTDHIKKLKRTQFLTGTQTVLLPVHDLLSGWRVYLGWHLHIGPFSVSSQLCWQPPLPWLQVTASHIQREKNMISSVLKGLICVFVCVGCCPDTIFFNF